MNTKANAVIGQSGGSTAVINQSLAGVLETARRAKPISDIWGMVHGIEGLLRGKLLNLRAQPSGLVKQIAGQPSSALGSSRYKLKSAEEFEVIARLKRWNIRYFFMIGGNDTAETILRVARAAEKEHYDLAAIHIPKTIDNDLAETDHCPGYGSIARFAAITTRESGLDIRAMKRVDRVKIIELMGRNSGWIVAASALLKKCADEPPHILCLPEIPFEEKKFLARVDQVLNKTGYCVAVISETIRDHAGTRIGAHKKEITHDPFGHQYVEGAAAHLTGLVERHLKVRARFDKPGTIARMAMPYVSTVDQHEAYAAGAQAVRWALAGKTKLTVAFRRQSSKIYRIDCVPVPVERIVGYERDLPKSFLTPDCAGINNAFRKYALPLLGPDLPDYPAFKSIFARLR